MAVTLADQEGNDRIRRAIEKGAQLGAMTGGAVGLFGGPAGATAGWATGEALLRISRNVIARMDERAAIRVSATELIIEHDARQHEERGESHRADGFLMIVVASG